MYAEIFGDDYYLAIVVNNINDMIDTAIMSEFRPWRKARDIKPYLCPSHVFVKYIFLVKKQAHGGNRTHLAVYIPPCRLAIVRLVFSLFNATNYLFYAYLEQCEALAIVAVKCSCYV